MTRWAPVELTSESILFADDHIVAVDKAPGVLCDASIDPNRDHLGKALERWAHDSDHSDTNFLPAHRLDRGTSGVVLFARNKAAATALMNQFQERTVSKQYQAVVTRFGDADWTVGKTMQRRSYLRHRKGTTEEVRSGGKAAESQFEVIGLDGPLALVRALPKTGRTHQLRVHLAALEAPIVGDDLYGNVASSRLWLHADTLAISHPISHEALVLRSHRTLHLANGAPHDRNC